MNEDLVRDGQLLPWFGQGAVHRSHQSALVRKELSTTGPTSPRSRDLLYARPLAAFPR